VIPLELETPRLRLHVVEPALAANVARYYRDNREHLQPTSPELPAGVDTAEAWTGRLERNRDLARAGWEYRYFLLERRGNRVVGTANLTEISRGHTQQCQLGFGIDATLQGRGLMREAIERLIDLAFGELRLMKVRAYHLPDNERSANLLERLGFTVDGLARRDVCIAGVWRDHVMRSLCNPEPERVRCNNS
jgi:ribosomal-protein-alanine N-acetyltransferase